MTPPKAGSTESNASAAQEGPLVPCFELSWDKATTPLEAIERSLYALADRLTGSVSESGHTWTVTIYPRASNTGQEMLEHRLRQEVNDQVLRVRIAERTDPVRNLVFALAFSRSGLTSAGGSKASEAEQP